MPKFKRPTDSLHRPSGQGRCRIGGKDFYLREYDSPASKARYEKLVGDWLARQEPNAGLKIDDLALQFLAHAESYHRHHRHPDGIPTGETRNLRDALQPLITLLGETPVISFGPRRLKLVRDEMIRNGKTHTCHLGCLLEHLRRQHVGKSRQSR